MMHLSLSKMYPDVKDFNLPNFSRDQSEFCEGELAEKEARNTLSKLVNKATASDGSWGKEYNFQNISYFKNSSPCFSS